MEYQFDLTGFETVMDGPHLSVKGDYEALARRMCKSLFTADGVYLDPPFRTGGQTGGRRNIAAFPTMSAEKLISVITLSKKLLKTDTSLFMIVITDGKSTDKMRDYLIGYCRDIMKEIGSFTYEKLYKNGNLCNIGRYPLPKERFYLFSKSGESNIDPEVFTNYRIVRPGDYPTQKPVELFDKVLPFLNTGGTWVDACAGSGTFYTACSKVGINTINCDLHTNPIEYAKQI